MSWRWEDYVLGEGSELWELTLGTTLYVLAPGFDPRSLVGIRRRCEDHRPSALRVLAIALGEPGTETFTGELARKHRSELEELTTDVGATLDVEELPRTGDTKTSGLALARNLIDGGVLDGVDHAIVDVSALPSSVAFPLIGGMLAWADAGRFSGDLQVVVCENPELDRRIVEVDAQPAAPIGGFKNGLDLEADATGLRVWAPVLGEGAGPYLDAIYRRLTPDEVCPVLPFPARNPRRADDIVLEHRVLLFDRIEIEPTSFLYAHESNPFDLYRALSRLQERYRRALEPVGDATVVISTHASKTLSLGALLAAYEHRLPVVSAGSGRYQLTPEDVEAGAGQDRLACLWLAGEPYRS